MPEDLELLRRYADHQSEDAFAELVRRHVDFVYSVALRHVAGDAHLAADVAQIVFTALARKAATLTGRPVLAGWLYRTTQFAAIDVVRTEARRRAREQEAQTMHELSSNDSADGEWEKLRPLLDRAIGELGDADRDAVVLRFFNGCSFAEIGARLRLTENAARMRVQRALDKLHAGLSRHGCTSTAAALAVALANAPGVAAPAGLAASVTGAALQATVAAGATTAFATFMSASKLQVGIASAVLAAGLGGYVVQEQTNARLRQELAALERQTATLAVTREEVGQLAATAAEAADLRNDDAELKRLADEAHELKTRMDAAARARAHSTRAVPPPSPTAGQPVYEVAQLDKLPRPTFQARPQYPISLRRLGIGGEAKISFVVDKKGMPQDVKVTDASHPELGEAAMAAIQKWRFNAGQKGGAAVNTRLVVPIVFSLNTNSGPAPAYPSWF